MIQALKELIPKLEPMMYKTDGWDSLIINRRKPHTYRAFRQLDNGMRLCIHRFEPCSNAEAFRHPHPWPGAFLVIGGRYVQHVWLAKDKDDKEPERVMEMALSRGALYEISKPMVWHSVQPLTTSWTIMLNGEPWDEPTRHSETRTTKGKDLDSMDIHQLGNHLSLARRFLAITRSSSPKLIG